MIIKKITAVLLCIVFAFAITPSVVFHNWLAKHTDTASRTNSCKGDKLQKAGFHCQYNHIVAESPFTVTNRLSITPAKTVFVQFKVPLQTAICSATTNSCSLRGPPLC